MTFVVNAPATPEVEPRITSSAFWPAIDPVQIRAAMRIDNTITAERLRNELIEAIASVNTELASYRILKTTAGISKLADVDPDNIIDDEPVLVHRYRRAVGCGVKANLIERYRDYDTTARGDKKADTLTDPIDDLRRDMRHAISDILGIGRTTVELI